jgi:hypothetical protein
MPDDHRPAVPQVTAVDDQFGTHRVAANVRCKIWLCQLRASSKLNHSMALTYQINNNRVTNSCCRCYRRCAG